MVGHLLTILAIVVGLIIVGLQHRSALQLQRANAREQLKLDVYKQIDKAVMPLIEANSAVSVYARLMPLGLRQALEQQESGAEPFVTNHRAKTLSSLHHDAAKALVDLMITIESWEIVFSSGELFRAAFSSAAHDAQEAHDKLLRAALDLLPIERPGTQDLYPLPRLSKEAIDRLDELAQTYATARDEVSVYAHDLRVESQNTLLSDLLERRVKERQPLDPEKKVLTANNASALLHYFTKETPAGRRNSATISAVVAEIEKRASSNRPPA